MLVFFSSYRQMDICIERWKKKGAHSTLLTTSSLTYNVNFAVVGDAVFSLFEKIQQKKTIVIEPRAKVSVTHFFPQATNNKGAVQDGAE